MKNLFAKFPPAIALAGMISAAASGAAMAGEGDKWMGASARGASASGASQAWGPGLMVRLRGLAVVPDEDGDNITANGVPITADITIDNSVVPELDLTYFFTSNIAAELILGVTPHDVGGTGLLQGALGDAWLLPPTLLAQYHFNPGSRFKPYVGAGVNYTFFFNESDSGAFLPNAGLTVSGIDIEDSFGWALQVGADIHLRDNMYLNIDVKKLWLETEATVTTTAGTTIRADVDINPWIFGIGVGWKFGGTGG